LSTTTITPDSAIAGLRQEEAVLCLAARTVLDARARAELDDRLAAGVDWKRLWRLGHRHEVLPLVTTTLTALARPDGAWSVPRDWIDAAQRRRIATLLQNRAMLDALRDLLTALGSAGVDVIPVKGLVLTTRLYGDLGIRPAADIDILVRREQLPEARAVLAQIGYRHAARPPYEARHHPFHDAQYFGGPEGTTCVELHRGLAAPAHFRLDPERLWEHSRTVEAFDMPVRLLSDVDTILHLAVHRTRSPLRLRWLVDIAESLRLLPESDEAALVEGARAASALSAMSVAMDLSNRLCGVPVSASLRDALAPTAAKRWLLERTCGVPAMFPATDVADDRQQPHLTYRVFEQDGAARIARSLAAVSARKVDKWRDRRATPAAGRLAD